MSLVSNLDKGVELCYYERYPLNKISLYLLDEGLQLCSFFSYSDGSLVYFQLSLI